MDIYTFRKQSIQLLTRLVIGAFSTNFEMKQDELQGLPGKWTMEDGYSNEVVYNGPSLYPLRILTYVVFDTVVIFHLECPAHILQRWFECRINSCVKRQGN